MSPITKQWFLICLMLCLLCVPAYADKTYTLDADFDEGTLLNINHNSPNNDQLQLNEETTPFPFINVAASVRGTVVRINTTTGQILGEYATAPNGRGKNPSRTTVDLYGNVWVGNRGESGVIRGVAHGSVVKIGLIVGGTRVNASGVADPDGEYLKAPYLYNTCVDRDNNGLIKTSRGIGHILPWVDVTDGVGGTTALVQDAQDECILIYQRLYDAPFVRHVSVDANNDVWVGGYPDALKMFYKLNGDTGQIMDSFDARLFGCGGYGGFIDKNGILWSSSYNLDKLLRYDIKNKSGRCIAIVRSYGLGIDTNGFIWNSMLNDRQICKLDSNGVSVGNFPIPPSLDGPRGVAVTPSDNHVWAANSVVNTVARLDNNGALIKLIPVGTYPTGVAVDSNGKVWVTNVHSHNVMRIDPNAGSDGKGAVDLTVSLGAGAGPYNYSDMTGIVLIGTTSPQGSWIATHDSGKVGATWVKILWNSESANDPNFPPGDPGEDAHLPAGTEIIVEARAADTESGLTGQAFIKASNGGDISLIGRFLEIRATLKTSLNGVTPI